MTNEAVGVQSSFVIGDVNGDGQVTSADATMLARWLAGDNITIDLRAAHIQCREDYNNDPTLDDLIVLAKALVGTWSFPWCWYPPGDCFRCN